MNFENQLLVVQANCQTSEFFDHLVSCSEKVTTTYKGRVYIVIVLQLLTLRKYQEAAQQTVLDLVRLAEQLHLPMMLAEGTFKDHQVIAHDGKELPDGCEDLDTLEKLQEAQKCGLAFWLKLNHWLGDPIDTPSCEVNSMAQSLLILGYCNKAVVRKYQFGNN